MVEIPKRTCAVCQRKFPSYLWASHLGHCVVKKYVLIDEKEKSLAHFDTFEKAWDFKKKYAPGTAIMERKI